MKLSSKTDLIVASFVFLIAAVASLFLASRIPEVLHAPDVWYDADARRVFRNMHGDRLLRVRDLLLHPLFSLLMRPIATGLTSIGLTPHEASTFVIAASAGAAAALLFLIARGLHLTLMSAGLTCVMFLVSATFSFGWSIVETFPIGGVTISFLLLIVVKGVRSRGIWVIASVLTLSITVTNGLVSFIGAYLKFGIWKAQGIVLASLVMLVLLLVVQQITYPVSTRRTVEVSVQTSTSGNTNSPPLPVLGKIRQYGEIVVDTYLMERRHLYVPHVTGKGIWGTTLTAFKGYAERAVSFLVYPGVVPRPALITMRISSAPRIRVDDLAYGPSGVLAVGCWIVLLVGGLKEVLSRTERCLFSKLLLYLLVFMFTLHMLYGTTPFLYSAHFVSPLVLLAACGFRGENRTALQIAGVAFCVSAVINNLNSFFTASKHLSSVS